MPMLAVPGRGPPRRQARPGLPVSRRDRGRKIGGGGIFGSADGAAGGGGSGGSGPSASSGIGLFG
eukprot:5737574-Alexandrium_andersonii.AAC.1